MLETHEHHGRAKLTATIVAVLVVAGIVVLADHLKSKGTATASTFTQNSTTAPDSSGGTSTPSTSSSTTGSSSSSTPSSGSSSGYKDGTYTSSSDYFVPSGDESIQVSLTLQNGVITDATVQNSENDPTSAVFQEDFAQQYKSAVVGQKITSLRIDTVAGASDTTQGFNDALSQIANRAQA